MLLISKNPLVSIQETIEEAKHNAETIVANVPFLKEIHLMSEENINRDNVPLLQFESKENLDETYLPEEDEYFIFTFRIKMHIRTFLSPLDVNWEYIVAQKKEFTGKKFLLNLASIAVLIFLTTPAV